MYGSSRSAPSRPLIVACWREVHGEQLRVDVVRPDIVRVKISRGGVFDEAPTFAVCVDPLGESVEFVVEQDAGVARLRTSELVVSIWLDPFRLDVHRPDGTAVIETAADDEGRFWPYAILNDAFTTRRRCRQEDAIYGLGEKTGHHNRRGREFTLWNTDVLDPHATREFTAGRPASDPRSDPHQHGIRPLLRVDPVLLPPQLSDRDDGRIVRRQWLPRALRLLAPVGIRDPVHRRSIHRVRLRRTGHARDPGRLHVADRTHRAAATVGARVPPMPLVPLHPGRGRADRQAAPRPEHPVRRSLAGHRIHGRLPRFHLGHPGVPRRGRHAHPARRTGVQGHHHRRPGR